MANLFGSSQTRISKFEGRSELQAGNPLAGWVYTSHYRWFRATPDTDAGSLTEFNTMGHSFQRAVAPNWSVVHTHTNNQISMLVDSNRWDAASLKQTMDEQVYRSTVGDTTWTVAEADGAWRLGDGTNLWTIENFRRNTSAYSYITEARFPETLAAGDVSDSTNRFAAVQVLTQSDTLTGEDAEYNRALRTGMNFNFGNFFDGTDRGINYPGDLATTTDNLYLLVLEGDDFSDTDVDQTSDAFYDINGDFEKIIGEFNPLAYTWIKDTETGLNGAEELMMVVDAKVVDPVAFRDRFNALGITNQTADNDFYIWITAPDLQWTGA